LKENINVLVLGFADPLSANTITDHLNAFENLDGCNVFVRNNYDYVNEEMFLPPYFDLDYFDVLIFHYSIYILGEDIDYLSDYEKDRIKNFNGLKIFFRQDEYYKVDSYVKLLNDMKADVLFTCVPSSEIEKVYPVEKLPNLLKVNTLTGFVPDNLVGLDVPKIKDRKNDVVYRGRTLPYWYGELGQEKVWIAEKFIKFTEKKDLKCDISVKETDRIYGDNWIDFIANSKATLGTESGASVFDFSGELKITVDKYMEAQPNASFYEVQERYLLPYEDKIYLHQISPRAFESICLKTAMILFEGEYSGILEPWKHYIPLKKDFSNIDEVLEFLKSDKKLQSLVDYAYEDIVLSNKYGYDGFIKEVSKTIKNELNNRKIKATGNPACDNEIVELWAKKLRQTNTIYVSYGNLNLKAKFIKTLSKYTNLEIHNYCEEEYDYKQFDNQCKIIIYPDNWKEKYAIRRYISSFMPASSRKTKVLVYITLLGFIMPLIDLLMLPIRLIYLVFPSTISTVFGDTSFARRYERLGILIKPLEVLKRSDYIFENHIKNKDVQILIIDNIAFLILLKYIKNKNNLKTMYLGYAIENKLLNKVEKITKLKFDNIINLKQRGRDIETDIYSLYNE